MSEAAHLSIGEVLSLLQQEFPDVTISKIRFLESQGLLDPERTPSGYRKFYEDDVERLRWILQQQRDHFLPLKVIKDRLDATASGRAATPQPEPAPTAPAVASEPPGAQPSGDEPSPRAPPPERPAGPVEARVAPPVEARPTTVPAPPRTNPLDGGPTDLSLTVDELCTTSGLTPAEVEDLQRFGLLVTRQVGADRYFDANAVVIAKSAKAFQERGIEPRHLRQYKVASEREAGFLEQVVMPMLKQRNPDAHQRAVETVADLAGLGQQLHAALLRQALDDSLG